ncbi:helix-turn-helix domain-containing protein [Agromyces sp. NPDC056523]|uniref:helix-turn-helix domain-containing protein n=1 Tax=Agromyces sp. NPDC056523 TaxID=3345850 RepID=UPI00366E19BB
MSFLYEEKASRSAFVDVVWRTVDTSDGTYLAAADACWDMIFSELADGGRRVLLSGPSSRPTAVPYTAGNRNIGVRFVQGCYFTHCPSGEMCDRTIALEMPQRAAFDLADARWPFPDYETVDDLVEAFAAHGLLAHDRIVESVLIGRPVEVSARSVQRHFAKVTGLSPHHVRQISRAREAVNRLRAGEAIAAVTYDLGYADQSHLTRDVKRLTGYTPGQSQHRGEPV